MELSSIALSHVEAELTAVCEGMKECIWLVCACEACVPERVGSAGCSIRLSSRDQHQFDGWSSEESQAHRYSLVLGLERVKREQG